MDSTGSLASSRSSGNYSGAYQHYATGAPGAATQPRGFSAATPSGAAGGSSHNLHGSSYGAPHSPASGGGGGGGRIDPSQMPRPDKPMLDVVFHTKSGSGRRNPPTCNSVYTAVDTGNCIPRHMRCTLVSNLIY